ncbi:hypothetical protein [Phaeospirillum tilakii]|uniref:Papain-like cysteine peptidase n=1 Tax=Phaeospirillum tilakii TaxID=741673 RepID=A0ABW5CB16_9PROT
MAPHRPEPPLSGAEIRALVESYHALAASGFQPDAFAEPPRHDFHAIDDDLVDYFTTHRPIPCRAEFFRACGELEARVAAGTTGAAERYLVTMLTRRFDNFRRGMAGRINLVSLGDNCYPHMIAVRWGYCLPRRFGGGTMPFDLVNCPIEATTTLLDSDFAGLLDPEALHALDDADCCAHARLGMVFRHEKGAAMRAAGFARLREIYWTRIERFRAALGNGRPTLFLFDHDVWPELAEDRVGAWGAGALPALRGLIAAVEGVCRGPFLLLLVSRAATPPDPALQALAGPRVRLVHCPFDRPGWWDVAVYASAAGLRFESGVVAAIEAGCRDLLAARAAAAS